MEDALKIGASNLPCFVLIKAPAGSMGEAPLRPCFRLLETMYPIIQRAQRTCILPAPAKEPHTKYPSVADAAATDQRRAMTLRFLQQA